MNSVKMLIKNKNAAELSFISPEAKIIEALRMMAENNIGALMVMQEGRLVGILSERDYARKVALLGRTSVETPVSDIMATPVLTVSPQQNREECMALMTSHRVRHLPVVDNGRVVGMLSIGDLVKDALLEQEATIHHLENYVNS